MQERHEIHVIGGGLTGLAAATVAARAGARVVLHEGRNRLGGRATTDERDGYRFDLGPHALYRGGAAERVLGELGIRPAGVAPLTDDVVHLSDGGPTHRAARRPVIGPDRVARLFVNLATRTPAGTRFDAVVVNGQPAWYATLHGEPTILFVPSFREERVSSILAVLNPDKLARFHAAWLATRP